MLLYLGWRILGSSARALPRPWAYALSHRLMDAVYRGWLPGRRALHANLQPVLGTDDPRQLERWSRRQLHRYSEYLVDALRLDALRPAECFAALETEPDVWPRLRAIYGREPILFALLHFGNWDVGGGAFSVGCGPSSVLVGPMGHPRLDRAIQAGRARLGMTPLSIERGVAPALRALRAGGTLALLFDRPLEPHEPGVDVRFFGQPCRLPAGMARLALATDARVVPLAVARCAAGRFSFRALMELDFQYRRSGDRQEDVRALTQGVLDIYEPWVRRHPDQWYQFRPFFNGADASP